MAEERSVNTLEITQIEGKEYVLGGAWPEQFVAEAKLLTSGMNPRTSAWDGNKLKLWLENGNAVYTIGDDFSPDSPTVTLYKMYGSEVKPVPGQDPPKKNEPEREMTEQERIDALKKATDLYLPPAAPTKIAASTTAGLIPTIFTPGNPGYDTITGGTVNVTPNPVTPKEASLGTLYDQVQWGNQWLQGNLPPYPDPYQTLSPLTRAVMGARAPMSGYLPSVGTPIPGSEGMNEALLAQKIVDTPAYREMLIGQVQQKVYERLRAEIDMGRIRPSAAIVMAKHPTNIQAAKTLWTDFLEDTSAFLGTMLNGLLAIGNTGVRDATLHVQDPLGLRGNARLRQSKGYHDLQPVEMTQRQFIAAIVDTARDLMGRASELQGRVDPERTLTEDQKVCRDVDGGIQKEVHDKYLAISKAEGTTDDSGYRVMQFREDAWDKWALERVAEVDSQEREDAAREAGRDYFKELAEHHAYLMEGDSITLEAKAGGLDVYVMERPDALEGGHLEIKDANPELTPEDIQRATDDAAAFNLTTPNDYQGTTVKALVMDEGPTPSDGIFSRADNLHSSGSILGGNGQMGGDE